MSLWVGVCVAIVVLFRLVFGVVPGRPIVRRRRVTSRTLLVFTLAGAMFALAGSGTATATTTSLTGTYDGGAQHSPAQSGGYDSPGASSSARWTHGGVTGAPVTAFAVCFAAEGGVVRHYTTSGAAESIAKGGSIEPGLNSGKIWVTPDRYASGAEARAKLALDKTPDGYFEIPTCRVKCPTGPSPVAPWNGQPGGGIEITTEFGIDIRGLIFRTFG